MATAYTFSGAAGDAWSDPSHWTPVGTPGAATGDSATIPVGKSCTYDYTNANNLAGLVINGGLSAATTASTYQLNMGASITGSGTFSAGSSTTPYPANCKFTVNFAGAFGFDCTSGLLISLYCAQPTYRYVTILGTATNTPVAIANISNARPAVVTLSAWPSWTPALANGQYVYISGVNGMTEINGQHFQILSSNSSTKTFNLKWISTSVSTADFRDLGTYTSGGTIVPMAGPVANATTMSIDTNVTGDPSWAAGAWIYISNASSMASPDGELGAIGSVTANSITVTSFAGTGSGLKAAKNSGSLIVLISRNIRITGTTSGQVFTLSNTTGAVLGCEISGVALASYGAYSTATNTNCTFSGTMTFGPLGTLYSAQTGATGITAGTNWTLSGVIAGAYYGVSSSNKVNMTTTGMIVSAQYGVYSGGDDSLNGTIRGCSAAINQLIRGSLTPSSIVCFCSNLNSSAVYNFTYGGTVYGMYSQLSAQSYNCTYSGNFYGSGYGSIVLNTAYNYVFSGKAFGMSYVTGGYNGIVIGAKVVDHNYASTGGGGMLTVYNSTFKNAYYGDFTNSNGYTNAICYNTAHSTNGGATAYQQNLPTTIPAYIWSFDPVIAGVSKPGRILGWNPGGKITNNESPPASPPVTLAYTHQFTFQGSATYVYPVYVDIPVMSNKANLNIPVYLKCSIDASTLNEVPRVQLIDPAQPFDSAASKVFDQAMSAGTNWQTIVAEATGLTPNKMYLLRVRGRHVTGPTLDWNYTLPGAGGSYVAGS